MEAVEDPGQLGFVDTGAAVCDLQRDAARHRNQPQPDKSTEGKFESIRQQVEYDLLPHVAVDVDRLGYWRTVGCELQTRFLDSKPENARQYPP